MSNPVTTRPASFFQAPIWLVGFRPFFTLAFIAGILLPLVWAAFFGGWLPRPVSGLSPVQWHAHEMLFGFGWAVLGGFLLTASKNWVNVRGLHGAGLCVAVLFWLAERLIILFFPVLSADASLALRVGSYLLASLFLLYVAGYLMWTLVRYRRQDSFRDNYFFLLALPLFLLAKLLLLNPSTWSEGSALALGLFRVAFVVMFERTITQFMKNSQGLVLLRQPALDFSIKALVLLAAFEGFLPVPLAAGLLLAASALLLVRYCLWQPLAGWSRFDTGTMYAGYLGLVLHLAFEAARVSGLAPALGMAATHTFTFLCMGIIIPAMLIRISQGHTGRKILFTTLDRVAIASMGAGAFFRLLAIRLWPDQYALWIGLAALCWSLCFLLPAMRLIPYLWQARVDGRIH